MLNRSWVICVLGAITLAACRCEDDKSAEDSVTAADPALGALVETHNELKGLTPFWNLADSLHLADIYQNGLYIDFGTPSLAKYTHGNWKSGWGSDKAFPSRTVTHVGSMGRLYFPVEKVEDLTLRMRLRPVGTQTVTLFINGRSLPTVRLDKGQQFADYDVNLPAQHLLVGDNYVLLRFGGTTHIGSESVSVAMESMRFSPAGQLQDLGEKVPRLGKMISETKLGQSKRPAISLAKPGRLSWHVQVPANAKLSYAMGSNGKGSYRVKITDDSNRVQEVAQGALSTNWLDRVLPLDAYSGRVVRVDFEFEGQGDFHLSKPTLWMPSKPDPKAKQTARNVVILLIDTLRADKLRPFNAQTRVKTPTMDQLAKEGTVFQETQAPENWTKPSVASVLTSLSPSSHCTKTDAARLSSKALMISEVLKKAGFSTASFIANGYVSDKFGFDQGWDHYENYIREGKSTQAANLFKDAADWIVQNKDKRFFAYVHTIDPHVPYDPPQKYLTMYDAEAYEGPVVPRLTADLLEKAKRNPPGVTFNARDRRRLSALYDGEISYHDDELAKFIARLREAGVYENTLFVVTSDHGEELNDHGSWGHGHSVYQELLHVPLIFRAPSVIPGGATHTTTASTLSIAPTVVEAVGVTVPAEFEGRSLLPMMREGVWSSPPVAFSDFLDDWRVVRAGNFKLVLRGGARTTLYDLAKDGGEKQDLDLAQYPVPTRYTRAMLGQFLRASHRGRWWYSQQGKGASFAAEKADLDPQTRAQLKAIGYVVEDTASECFGEKAP